jgi:DNA-directed RNA polymerase specialized sigma24 family protein
MSVSSKPKEAFHKAMAFNVDCSNWVNRLDDLQGRIVEHLIRGSKPKEIAKIVKATVSKVKSIVREILEQFLNCCELDLC